MIPPLFTSHPTTLQSQLKGVINFNKIVIFYFLVFPFTSYFILMKCNFVGGVMWTQGDSTSSSNICMIKGTSSGVNNHWCGACHNTSDAKVRTGLWNKYGIIKNARLSLFSLGVMSCVPFHGSQEGFIYLALGSSRCGVNVPFG